MALKLITIFLLVVHIIAVIGIYFYLKKDFALKRTVISNEIPVGAVVMDVNCDKKQDYVIGSSHGEEYILVVVLSAFTEKPIIIEYPILMGKLKFSGGYCADSVSIRKEYVSRSTLDKLELNITDAESLTQCGNISLSNDHCKTYHIFWRKSQSIFGSWTN